MRNFTPFCYILGYCFKIFICKVLYLEKSTYIFLHSNSTCADLNSIWDSYAAIIKGKDHKSFSPFQILIQQIFLFIFLTFCNFCIERNPLLLNIIVFPNFNLHTGGFNPMFVLLMTHAGVNFALLLGQTSFKQEKSSLIKNFLKLPPPKN